VRCDQTIHESADRSGRQRGGCLLFTTTFHRDHRAPHVRRVPLQVLLPAYMLSELEVAFLIGFQIYLPFLILDIVVASVTISMGMLMLPPVMISLPFKLMLFVLVDGWRLVVGMLLETSEHSRERGHFTPRRPAPPGKRPRKSGELLMDSQMAVDLGARGFDDRVACGRSRSAGGRCRRIVDQLGPSAHADPGSDGFLRAQDCRHGGDTGPMPSLADRANDDLFGRRDNKHPQTIIGG